MFYVLGVTSNNSVPGTGHKRLFLSRRPLQHPSNTIQLQASSHLGLEANALVGQSWSGSPDARLGHWVLIIAKGEVKMKASSLKIKLHLRSPQGKGVWVESKVLSQEVTS